MTCSLPSASTGNDSVLLRNSYGRVIVNDSCRFEPGTIGKVRHYLDPTLVKQLPEENEPGGAEKNPGATTGISSGFFNGPDNLLDP